MLEKGTKGLGLCNNFALRYTNF